MGETRQKITIYLKSELMGNTIAHEAYLVEQGRKPYAQYPQAPYVRFIPKGKRTVYENVQTFKPWMVIVDGWNNPKPGDMWGNRNQGANGVETYSARFASFDEGWTNEGNKLIASIEPTKIIADFRETDDQASDEVHTKS